MRGNTTFESTGSRHIDSVLPAYHVVSFFWKAIFFYVNLEAMRMYQKLWEAHNFARPEICIGKCYQANHQTCINSRTNLFLPRAFSRLFWGRNRAARIMPVSKVEKTGTEMKRQMKQVNNNLQQTYKKAKWTKQKTPLAFAMRTNSQLASTYAGLSSTRNRLTWYHNAPTTLMFSRGILRAGVPSAGTFYQSCQGLLDHD